MGYTVLKSFGRGIDTRRMYETTEVGGLIDAMDCHITRGGEIEKRLGFIVVGTFPAGTVGFYATPGKIFHTWGTPPSAPVGMPPNSVYHSIPDDSGAALTAILCVEEFQSKLYVIAKYVGGIIRHWWDDQMVRVYVAPAPPIVPEVPTDPVVPVTPPPTGQTGGKAKVSFNLYVMPQPTYWPAGTPYRGALSWVWLTKPGTKYIFSGASQDAWSLIATNTVDSTGKPVNSPGLAVSFASESNIAAFVASKINEFTGGPTTNFAASAAGTQITIWADEVGTKYNGWSIFIGVLNDVAYPAEIAPLAGGLDRSPDTMMREQWPDTYDTDDANTPMMLGTYALAHGSKMYTVNGSKLNISMLLNPTRWDDNGDAIGAGFIQMDTVTDGTPVMLAMADYQGSMALFGLNHVLIWQMDDDPDQNFRRQTLHNIGLVAPHAQVPWGDGDVLFLSRGGVRSLRTRTGVDEAYATDIGTPIDIIVRDKLAITDQPTRFLKFWAEVEPISGRLWMALYDMIYVLSYYQDNRVAAWTRYNATTYPVDYMHASDDIIFWRSGNNIIAYGGMEGTTYDATECLVRTPYVDAGTPATSKNWSGVDLSVLGTWEIKASFDPTQPAATDLIANITKSTYQQQKIAMNGESPAISLVMKSSYVGVAKIGNAAVHYTDSTAD